MSDKLHEGHRERMCDKFLRVGDDALEDHELLEMLLFPSISRKNTNDIAHLLMDKFGSLHGVFNADIPALMSVDGIGMKTAVQIKVTSAVWQRCNMFGKGDRIKVYDEQLIGKVLIEKYKDYSEEEVVAMAFDSSLNHINNTVISRGSLTSSEVSARKIAEFAIVCNAAYIALAHNHLNGSPVPSEFDIMATKQIRQSLNILDIDVIEHFVIGKDSYRTLIEKHDAGLLYSKE